jgi:homoserine kinase type II
MAVYTVLEREDLEALIEPFGIGPLLNFAAVADGIENTTYFLSTDQSQPADAESSAPMQHYVLTVFEEITFDELPFYVRVTTTLNAAGLPVPCPLRDYNGNAIQRVQDKPALLFPKVSGRHPMNVDAVKCTVIGTTLARMHVAGSSLHEAFAGCRSPQWVLDSIPAAMTQLSAEDKTLMQQQGQALSALLPVIDTLPQGVIHNDLFRDNTLFDGDRLTGIIDFYNASRGALLMDVAITVNDWCSKPDGSINVALASSLLVAYSRVRPLKEAEREHWPALLRGAALRFWVSRLVTNSTSVTRKGALIARKDPNEYRDMLRVRIRTVPPLPI